MMARPRATSERTNSGVTKSGTAGAEAFAVVVRGLRALQHFLAAEIFALGDVDHFLGDDAGARPFELGEGVAACEANSLPRLRGRVGDERPSPDALRAPASPASG